MSCDCHFCCSMCEGYIEMGEKCIHVGLPARILDIAEHRHGILYSVDPVRIKWTVKADSSLTASGTVCEVEEDKNLESFAELQSVLKKRRLKLGVKVDDNNQKMLVDVQKLSVDQFEIRDPSDPTALTMVEYEVHPRFTDLQTVSNRIMDQMVKRQRIDGEHVIQMEVVDIPDLSSDTRSSWTFASPRDTWNTRAVSLAIMTASPNDVLPELRIIGSENDGGFWCVFTHPETKRDVKLLLSIVPLAWWRPYAQKVEDFMLQSNSTDGVTGIMKSGRRAIVVNAPALPVESTESMEE
jgi:hypothetical protein